MVEFTPNLNLMQFKNFEIKETGFPFDPTEGEKCE